MILIKGVEYPHTCEECPCFTGNECKAMNKPTHGGKRPTDCPVRPTSTHRGKMYICECGGTFDESEMASHVEREGDKYNYGYLYFPCCPYCGSENFTEAEECDICAEFAPTFEMMHINGACVCAACAEKITKMRSGTAKQ